MLFAKQNDRQSEEINVTDEPQVENRPVPLQEAEIRWTKNFLGRPLCLLCLAAAQKITHAAHSLSRLGELYVKAGYICFNPSSQVARLAGAPSAPFIQTLRFLSIFIERDRSGGWGGGELMWTTCSAPPLIFCLLRAWGPFLEAPGNSRARKAVLFSIPDGSFKTFENYKVKVSAEETKWTLLEVRDHSTFIETSI